MSDKPAPETKVTVTLSGREWEMVPTGKLTYPEAKEIKRVSGGMSVVDLEQGIAGADPDAWFSWMYVSIRRQWPQLTTQELEEAIGDTPIVAIIESVNRQMPEGVTPFPGMEPSPNGSNGTQMSIDSGEPTLQPSIPATPGSPGSETQE